MVCDPNRYGSVRVRVCGACLHRHASFRPFCASGIGPDPRNAVVHSQLRVYGMQDNEALLENRTMYMLKVIPNASNNLGFLIEVT